MSKLVWGVSALHHDAAMCVIELSDDKTAKILYASHAERYSRVKNDPKLNSAQVKEAMAYGLPESVYWYEDPYLKHKRWLFSGQIKSFLTEPWPHAYLDSIPEISDFLNGADLITGHHHKSHLYSGLATIPFFTNTLGGGMSLIIDAIGEYQTSSVWHTCSEGKTRLVAEETYPKSIGLLYAVITQYVGLKPMEEEFILMGMAAYGTFNIDIDDIIECAYATNLYKGLSPTLKAKLDGFKYSDIAATLQDFVERETMRLLTPALSYSPTYLNLGGGAALNCVNNATLAARYKIPTWIFPNAGDAGTCVGAVMQHYPEHKIKDYSPFSGTDANTTVDPVKFVDELLSNQAAGLFQGRAEFGPRALGNRSVIADPRKTDVKDRVNQYKNRQQFRPLAPMVLERYAKEYFAMPDNVADSARYMQVTTQANPLRAHEIPAVIHKDGTARIQVIKANDPAEPILEEWYRRTGCPVLLNTSLNVRGEPLVNTVDQAANFEAKTGIRVFR